MVQEHAKDNRVIIYIDESGFAHDMPRTHGYAPKGQRCIGTKNWNAKGRTNAIGALHGSTLLTLGLFDTIINADVFTACVVQDLIAKAGHLLVYLPPYSPDLNPIEHKWAQAKALRRKTHCSVYSLLLNNQFI